MVIVILLTSVIFYVINSKIFGKKINYLNSFVLMWGGGGVSIISSFGFYDLFIPPEIAYLYILTVMITFELATIFFP